MSPAQEARMEALGVTAHDFVGESDHDDVYVVDLTKRDPRIPF